MKTIVAVALALSTAAHAQSNNLCRGMTDQECIARALAAAKEQRLSDAQRAATTARITQSQHALYLDHWEPKRTCRPSSFMTHADAIGAWAGSSSGPQGWDCDMVMVPVYR